MLINVSQHFEPQTLSNLNVLKQLGVEPRTSTQAQWLKQTET